MPLLDEVVEKREQMNDNDRQFALRIYQENMRDVMDYRIERDKKITVSLYTRIINFELLHFFLNLFIC